jgi:putative two-component system response regulator
MTINPMNRPTILIVDDTPDNIMLLSRLLKDKYATKVATNGATALQIARAAPELALILLDVMMPGMDGYETCRQLKADPRTADIPVIFLTARTQIDDEASGLALGAVDYLVKPVNPAILFARVAAQLNLRQESRRLKAHNQVLENLVSDLRELHSGQGARIQSTMQALARRLQCHPRFAAELADERLAPLCAPQPPARILACVREAQRWQQERWDGSGYPDRLAGDAIPLAARLMAVAAVYDALATARLFGDGLSHAEALASMAQGRGSHFDPDVLDGFLELELIDVSQGVALNGTGERALIV